MDYRSQAMSAENLHNISNYDCPMYTGSPNNSPDRSNIFTHHSVQLPYKVDTTFNQYSFAQKQYDNRYLNAQVVSITSTIYA